LFRALRERQRVAIACAEVDSLEEIVDCYTSGAPDEELWRAVADSATLLGRAPTLVAYRSGESLRFAAGSKCDENGPGAVLSAWEIPLAARDNLLVECIESGRIAETSDVAALAQGATSAGRGDLGKRRKVHFLVTPLAGEPAALVAVAEGRARANQEGLRIVAERAAMVRQARLNPRASLPDIDAIEA
jgi:hypothetical protein